MSLRRWVSRVCVSVLRFPLRVVDWIKTKLGYVSVPPLREFVYLDETSVVSLIASTTGGVTEQKSTVKRRQISGSITSGLGNNTPDVNANVGATREQSSEAVHRYVIQSNFKELYEMRADNMVISDGYESQKSIPSHLWDILIGNETEADSIKEIDFKRGDLAEINVNLGSHDVYDFYTATASIAEIFDALPAESRFMQAVETQELSLEELEAFSSLVEHLLTGLVPITGEVVEYGVVVEDDAATIISKEYAEKNDIEYDRLNIVGFVNSDKFWQEETRFLFDNDEYTVYCRLDDGKVSEEWMPIKLISVVDSIVTGLGDSLRQIPELVEKASAEQAMDNRVDVDLQPRLEFYLEMLDSESDLELGPSATEEVVEATLHDIGDTAEKIEDIEGALERLEQELNTRDFDYDLKDNIRADLIDQLLARDFDALSPNMTDKDWFLEVSFTAIYW